MKRIVLGVMLITATCNDAFAQKQADLNYLCVAEAAGGIRFSDQAKKWEGVRFQANDKFLLRLKFSHSRNDKTVFGYKISYNEYFWTMKDIGSETWIDCLDQIDLKKKTVSVSTDPTDPTYIALCRTGTADYQFNIHNSRFLKVYPNGFVDGKDTNENNPAMIGGSCTKID